MYYFASVPFQEKLWTNNLNFEKRPVQGLQRPSQGCAEKGKIELRMLAQELSPHWWKPGTNRIAQ
jgi:hypothetical protein